jgi:formate hydrogenlyase subunit 3/multisubunit Na+/H+ antiporter MnhD subunit
MTSPIGPVRRRFWIETVLASLATGLGVLTLFWHEWIEAFGFDQDHGNGTAEWLVVAGLFVGAAAFAVLARVEWRRRRELSTA